MSATTVQAVEEILTLFKSVWDPTTHPVQYEATAKDASPPNTNTPWARVTIRHTSGGQESLSDESSLVRWSRTGFLTVQVFTPIGRGLTTGYNLAKIITDVFEGSRTISGVWFRNVRVNEIGPDGAWYQHNVIADFTYDEVR